MKKEIAFSRNVSINYPIEIDKLCVNGGISLAQGVSQPDVIRELNFSDAITSFNNEHVTTPITAAGIYEFRGPYNPGGGCDTVLFFCAGPMIRILTSIDNQIGTCLITIDEAQFNWSHLIIRTTFRTKEDCATWYDYISSTDSDSLYEPVKFYGTLYKWA